MDNRYDAIVIGAGLGGMLASAILARRGRRVLVLEREADVGGRLRSYEVDGFVIDAGAYLWPNAHLDEALDAAGVRSFRGSAIPPTQVMRVFVQGRGGRRFAFPWPGRPETPALLEAAEATLGADAATYRELAAVWEEIAGLSDGAVESMRGVPLRVGLRKLVKKRRVAQAFRRNVMLFGTYDPDSAPTAECVALRRRKSTGRPARPECPGANLVGGVRALPTSLYIAMSAHGVDLRLGHTVDHIEIEDGRAIAVRAHGVTPFAARFEAPSIICNAPVWTLFGMVAPRHFDPDFVRHGLAFSAVGGAVCAAFAFNRLPRLRETGEPDTFPGWTRLLTGADAGFGGGFLWTTHHSPNNAPAGMHVLQAMRLSPLADVADPERAAVIGAAFRAMLDEIYLDAREAMVWSRDWISREGSEYMICAAPRPPVKVPGVEGLFLVGETTDVPAVQMDAAALSALRCVELIEK